MAEELKLLLPIK